jgi:Flp pilus assembly protein TadB
VTPAALVLGSLATGLVVVVAAPPSGVARGRVRVPIDRPRPATRAGGAVVDPRRMVALVLGPLGRPRPMAVAQVAVAVVALGLIAPPLAPVPLAIPVVRAQLVTRRRVRAEAAAVTRGLPDAVDLLLLCAGAGLSLPLAHPLVAARAPAPLGSALRAADEATAGGAVRADALLEALVPLGDRAAALAHVLVDHLRYGVPLVPGLERLGLELRLDRRRRAEEEARRVPLRLLAPLISCVLPAFGLLTVVPLLVASLRSLPR